MLTRIVNLLKKDERGFTLIELMVVIIIIGIIAAIAIPNLMEATGTAEASRVQSDVSTLESAAAVYYAENRAYTSDAGELEEYMRDGEIPEYDGDFSGDFLINTDTGKIVFELDTDDKDFKYIDTDGTHEDHPGDDNDFDPINSD